MTEKKAVTRRDRSRYDLFEWDKLFALMENNAKMADCEELLGSDRHTIHRYIKKRFGQEETFETLRFKKLSKTRMKLQQTALKKALDGKSDRMLEFALKNICSWTDSPVQVDESQNIELDFEV